MPKKQDSFVVSRSHHSFIEPLLCAGTVDSAGREPDTNHSFCPHGSPSSKRDQGFGGVGAVWGCGAQSINETWNVTK